ncbi:MAG: DUF815 domain-containing protein, partial [Proteobacteria bacterium]|nr:DUF815 domain-containing protein [Pseudomonadota bacterium]
MSDTPDQTLLRRIAEALDRLAPPCADGVDLSAGDAFIWRAEDKRLDRVADVNRVDLGLLKGIDRQRDILLDNTKRFADGLPA